VAAADGADDGFDVPGGAGKGQVQQHLFGGGGIGRCVLRAGGTFRLDGTTRVVVGARVGSCAGGDPGEGGGVRAGDAGDGADLGVGDPAGGERFGDRGQVLQGVGDADVFGGGAQAHPGSPGQPVGAGPQPDSGPAAAVVELGQQLQEPALGRGDVPGQAEQLGLEVAGAHALQQGR
jgi:hypothetical protein